jgi:CRISPR-associated protein Cas1
MGRVIEIADPLVNLSIKRGFVVVKINDIEKTQIPTDDIEVLILNGTGASITTNLLNQLLNCGAMVIVLGENYSPSGIFYPTDPHFLHKQKINLQINASKPLNKKLWQAVVKAKILNQSAILAFFTKEDEKQLIELAKKVGSGDPENIEAQAAKKYWQKLFGEDFRRDYASTGINSMLNYGYAILRSATARSIFSCGLNPVFGIHHHNLGNAFCLVDDLMEPYRPIVDFIVKRITESKKDFKELNPEIKKTLSKVLTISLNSDEGIMPLNNSILRLCQSFVRSLENGEVILKFPDSPLPIDLEIL